jgi:hypothetical protein
MAAVQVNENCWRIIRLSLALRFAASRFGRASCGRPGLFWREGTKGDTALRVNLAVPPRRAHHSNPRAYR